MAAHRADIKFPVLHGLLSVAHAALRTHLKKNLDHADPSASDSAEEEERNRNVVKYHTIQLHARPTVLGDAWHLGSHHLNPLSLLF